MSEDQTNKYMEEYPVEESDQQFGSYKIGLDARVIHEFIVDDSIPEAVQREFWSLWGKDNILGNIDETQARILRRRMVVMLEKLQQWMPYHKITPEVLSTLKNIEQTYNARLTRAMGPKRERILLSTQTEEKRIITENEGEKKSGIVGKAKNFFGFGGGVE